MMATDRYRLVILGAGCVGGDCTWTGCVHRAELAPTLRQAQGDALDFARATHFVREAIQRVYRFETPEVLAGRGIADLVRQEH
ncbi:MAG TPA: hypothetical protein VGL99_16740 [Chloroflexota bacterium]